MPEKIKSGSGVKEGGAPIQNPWSEVRKWLAGKDPESPEVEVVKNYSLLLIANGTLDLYRGAISTELTSQVSHALIKEASANRSYYGTVIDEGKFLGGKPYGAFEPIKDRLIAEERAELGMTAYLDIRIGKMSPAQRNARAMINVGRRLNIMASAIKR